MCALALLLPDKRARPAHPCHAGAEVRERDETGKVWSWPEGGSTDFEEEEDDETLGGGGGGSASAGRRRGGARAQQQQLQLETQPFPAEALTAARMGAALQAAEEAGVDLPLALRAAAAARASSSGRPTSSSGGGSTAGSTAGSSPGGGFGKPADPAAVHIYAFGGSVLEGGGPNPSPSPLAASGAAPRGTAIQ